MKVKFWLLDLNSELRSDVAEIWLWGVDHSGRRVLIIDKTFSAYFYALIEDGVSASEIVDKITKQNDPFIVKLEIVERRFFGKPVKAVKVYCKNPDALSKSAEALRKFEGVKDCLEDDIRSSMRYLIDNNIAPSSWHEAEVEEAVDSVKAQVDQVYVAKCPPKPLNITETPQLRILGFSTLCYSREGSPKAERNPVIVVSAATNHGEEKQFMANEKREDKPVLEAFVNYIRSFNPDIIVGYGINGQDWPYLKKRCEVLGLHLNVARTETEPHQSIYGHISVTGRANIDLLDYADDFPEVKVKTLANLADHLSVMKIADRTIVEETDFADYWHDLEKHEILKRFSMDNVRCVMGIAGAVLDFGMQLSSLVDLPLDHVGTAAAGFRVEWFLIKHTHEIGELVPRRIERPYVPYAGAVVLTPKPGIHENIVNLDFKSMYPSIMIAYNLSPDTYVSPEEPEPPCGVYKAPEVGHKFRKEPAGFFKEVLTYLIRVRDEVRSKMASIPRDSVEYRVLDARQKAVKVITNATYGYAGWIGARWYVKPVAESAAAWGRYTIQTAIRMAEQDGLKVVYGDTDSLFVGFEKEKIERLSKHIQKELGLEIKPDKMYSRIFFTEAKKRYAGLLPDGRLDIVGLEVMRGDWAEVARKVQEKVLEIILKEQSPKKATRFVQDLIIDLRQKRVPYHDLIIWKTLSKPVEAYEVKASHVEAAKMLQAKGWKLSIGDKVGYVVVTGTGRLYERVKPYMFASYDEVDPEYYVSKQVVPASARVLEFFNVTIEDLLSTKVEEKKTRSLSDFF